MIYKIRTRVKSLEFKKRAVKANADKTDPDNPKVIWEYEDLGWFVTFENSHESLFLGIEEPTDMKVDTKVTILILPEK
jgi:hypothetical protein